MKKGILFVLFIFSTLGIKAQYAEINKILTILEERKGIHNIENIDLNNQKFVLIKEFDDHNERHFVIFNGDKVTYVEIFDDKKSGETYSNVFSGDMVKNKKGVISIRCDLLEGKKIPIAVTKTFLPHQQRKIIYLVDMNTKERWINEKKLEKAKSN